MNPQSPDQMFEDWKDSFMETQGSRKGLEELGLTQAGTIWRNLTTSALYEQTVRRQEGTIAHLGPLVIRTGQHTGRAPNDKFVVDEPTSTDKVWWGMVNKPFEKEQFEKLLHRAQAYLQGKDLFIQDCYAGADPEYRMPITVITDMAWQSLFARNMFIRAKPGELETHEPEFTVVAATGFHTDPEIDGSRSDVCVLVNFERRLVLIAGSQYGGEIKKSIFTVLNYMLPLRGVLSMHASANVGPKGDAAVFFGLSGTGKTTLSADSSRTLIGDDEHGWSDRGIFNFEGGCYAKVIRLSPEAEPEIYQTTRRFGTILENVAMDPRTRRLDLDDGSLTENTRAAYPITHISNADYSGMCGHPSNIIMLTADAFGVLPPISRLSTEQAMYHFLSGYTAKVAGTEKGIDEPQATFSACFGAPFMVLHPTAYANMLGERIKKHNVNVWLINTGWTGGPAGVGHRMKISYTRAMVQAALEGKLDDVPTTPDPVFGVGVPQSCPNVPQEVLQPRHTWDDKDAYDGKARELANLFHENFKQFEDQVTPEIRDAGPIKQ